MKCVECREETSNTFCAKCITVKCKRCGIILSKKFKCRCRRVHGYYFTLPNLCAECDKLIISDITADGI